MTTAQKKPFSKQQNQGQRFNSFEKLRDVVRPAYEQDDVAVRRKPQAQPEPLVFTGALNAWYKTKRNGIESSVYLVEVRKDVAIYKDQVNDKHSQSLSLAKFLKFYKAV
ncbi:hypothetical protein D3C85_15000 [compost metagenome]